VECALEIQQTFFKANADLTYERHRVLHRCQPGRCHGRWQ
jgi:hypothetical protein